MLWSDARKRHSAIARAAEDDIDGAKLLWRVTKGDDTGVEPDSYAEACFDASPTEHAGILSDGGTANAYAMSCLWAHWWKAQTATPLERREYAREAWAKFDERAKLAGSIKYGLGFDLSEAWECTRDVSMQQVDPAKMKRIADLAGRMFATLHAAKATKVNAAPEEIHSVEMGADLAWLLPSELVVMGTAFECLLYDKLADRKAMQYALCGEGPAGRGPFVIALDESGSMHAERQEWSKAAAVALTRIAHEENRKVAIVHYSTSVKIQIIEPGDSKGITDLIGQFMGGGTRINMALDNSADQVEALHAKGDKGADVILITDGLDHCSNYDGPLNRLEAMGARLFTVAIECGIDADSPLRTQAERYIPIGGAELAEGGLGAMADAVI